MQIDPSVPLFGYIGRLEEQKGVDVLCAALPTALQNGNIQVAILGTGDCRALACALHVVATVATLGTDMVIKDAPACIACIHDKADVSSRLAHCRCGNT